MKAPFYKVYLGIDERRDITQFVESLHYEDCIGEDSYVNLKIWDNFAGELIDDEDIITGKIISFQFGYLAGMVSPIHKARLTDIEPEYGERVTLNIKALDLGTKMKRSTANKVWDKVKSSDIAKTIAAQYGLEAEVEPTTRTWSKLPQGNKSDFDFLKYLAKREDDGNFVTFIRNEKLYFVRRGLNKECKYTFAYGSDGVLLNFKPKFRESTSDAGHIKSKTSSIDMLTKQTSGKSADSKNQKNAIDLGDFKTVYDENGNKVGDKSVKTGKAVKVVQAVTDTVMGKAAEMGSTIITPTKDAKEAEDLMNSHKKESTLNVLEASWELEGHPLLEPDNLVGISNVGKRYLGNWYIKKVTHDVSSSGYLTNMETTKNGVKSNTGGEKSKNVNNSKGKKPGSGDDPRIISVYDQDGNHIGDRTQSGKYIPLVLIL